jgi:hypothetical protein
MPNKIPFHSLIEKIQSGKITDKEVAQYFIAEPHPSQPFDFVVGINTDRVDVSNVENAALLAGPLLQDAGTVSDRKRRKKATAKHKRKSPLIAEGDSWFRLPQLIYPPTLIDILQNKYSINNLAQWGDTLAEILLAGEFWPHILPDPSTGEYKSDVLLFSGGGNDVLGGDELWRFLNLFDVDHTKPTDAPYYVNRAFYENLEIIADQYDALIQQIKYRAPKVMMVAHGYDYALPQNGGRWLYSPMIRQGFDPMFTNKNLCAAIIRVMINAFNNKLAVLEQRHPKNFRHVDLRGTIKAGEWFDELHPKRAGATKTAAKFAAALQKLPAAAKMQPPIVTPRMRLLQAA